MQECLDGVLQKPDGLIALDAGKVVQEAVQRVAGLQVIEERLYRNPGADEHGSPAENFGVTVKDGFTLHGEAHS